ncbi:MAG: DNA primase [Propionibacteriaceae bacterium]|nr:DNA primase [Propionibacteriaceae bacterium]
MAGLFKAEDLDEVRTRARIDDVVSAHVTLKPAGAGTLKGLCPFHDEKTPSFQVTPTRGLYYCFGCGKGGDTVNFVEEINNLSFREAVEFLADKYGVRLRYEEDSRPQGVSRSRLLEANSLAAEFYSQALSTPDAETGRTFLLQRGFDEEATQQFCVGFSPRGGRDLVNHLKTRGFSDKELLESGLMRTGGWDYFQSRLMWPIRDAGASVLGFGARRLFDDDRMPAKYINTPETPLYHKSHVLYGLDLARTAIASKGNVVVVEGYTDVMACHLAGVTQAVASCGTAFGSEHAKLIQRLLGAQGSSGKVIFTFDGDEAGHKAAVKVFQEDSTFLASTWVAVAPKGLDPCDLRLQQSDQAVRDLVANPTSLYDFVTLNILEKYDMGNVDARLAAVRECASLVSAIRDPSKVDEYVTILANRTLTSPDTVRREIKLARGKHSQSPHKASEPAPTLPGAALPHPQDRALLGEREVLKFMVQDPSIFEGDEPWYGLTDNDFTHPAYQGLFRTITQVEDPSPHWAARLVDKLTHQDLKTLTMQLSVEDPVTEVTPRHGQSYAARLKLVSVERSLAELKATMHRINPQTNTEEYTPLFQQMITLETQRKALKTLTNPES